MLYIGKIDREKFKLITQDITTQDVIITDKQVEHIKYLRNKEIVWRRLDKNE